MTNVPNFHTNVLSLAKIAFVKILQVVNDFISYTGYKLEIAENHFKNPVVKKGKVLIVKN